MNPLYMTDSYLREFSAVVSEVDGTHVALSQTAFYPNGGGQPADFGSIMSENGIFNVVNVIKKSGEIWHEVTAEGLKVGDSVTCTIDWERRYRLMRMHTAAHILDAVFHKATGALATGNQLGVDKSRIDFSLEALDKEKINSYIEEANRITESGIEVKVYFLKREEALKIPGVVKLANAMPPEVAELRIVEIPGVDIQADGGTQVKNTKEIGKIVLLSVENRGKN
ncbi:MAG: alanyl-tRNA editing protein, partial [Candidatus Aenigmarchaeota archaeon]|nr:alanyl-tRNA editing protein [Candidatus Aenigmarchaeota archaeon]